jgi:hypothetical protein
MRLITSAAISKVDRFPSPRAEPDRHSAPSFLALITLSQAGRYCNGKIEVGYTLSRKGARSEDNVEGRRKKE